MSWLRRFAAGGAAPVFPAVGEDALRVIEDLLVSEDVSFALSPRHAAVLLVAGDVGRENRGRLRRVHDQLPHPRATVWWNAAPDEALEAAVTIRASESPVGPLVSVYRDLMAERRKSEGDLLPDEPPAPWRGKGDHGQGGEGMIGGKPYGRPMAMTGKDIRDGLALDTYTAEFGPFLPFFPPGLRLQLTLQGDVIQDAKVLQPPFRQRTPPPSSFEVPLRSAPQGEAEEGARRQGDALRIVARVLRVIGLPAQAERFFREARALESGGQVSETRLRGDFRRSGALYAIPPGLGTTGSLGRDVRSRIGACLEEAFGSSGRFAPSDSAKPPDLAALLKGLEWHEAVLVLNSYGVEDLRRMCRPPADAGEPDRAGKEQ